jgi:hypothetical protein
VPSSSNGTTPVHSPTTDDTTPKRQQSKEEKRDKHEKKEKREKKHKRDKKNKKKRDAKNGDEADSSDADDFALDDEERLMDTLRKEHSNAHIRVAGPDGGSSNHADLPPPGSPLNPAFGRGNSMQPALRRMASRIQQQSTVVSLLPGGASGHGPVAGQVIKILNRAGGFMFLSSAAGKKGGGSAPTSPPSAPVPDQVSGNYDGPQRPVEELNDHDHDDQSEGDPDPCVAPYAAVMSSAAVAPRDDPDTQRHLVQSLTVPGHPGAYITLAAKAPVAPTVFLGAAPPPATHPFGSAVRCRPRHREAKRPPTSGGGGAATGQPRQQSQRKRRWSHLCADRVCKPDRRERARRIPPVANRRGRPTGQIDKCKRPHGAVLYFRERRDGLCGPRGSVPRCVGTVSGRVHTTARAVRTRFHISVSPNTAALADRCGSGASHERRGTRITASSGGALELGAAYG